MKNHLRDIYQNANEWWFLGNEIISNKCFFPFICIVEIIYILNMHVY